MTGSDSDSNVLDSIKGRLQHILTSKFSGDGYYKTRIDAFNDRWNFACPFCGDSRSDVRKKRGNLYLDSLKFHCYNCGEHMGINRLLHSFGEDLDSEDQIAVHEIQQSSKKFEKKPSAAGQSMSMTLLDRMAVPKMILFKQLGIISPYKDEFVSGYLKSRRIDIRLWKYFAYDTITKELYILNISPEDRIIGYQVRQLDSNSRKARYMSHTLSDIYTNVFHKDINEILERILKQEPLGEKYIQEEDGIENISANLDRLSGMFNIMNVNLADTITVMEGPIDSLAIPNSIALQGATKKLNSFFDEVENVRYLFDNDKAGKEMAIRKLKDGKKVFLWDMYMKSISTKEKIKDVNDLQKKDLFNQDKIDKCFSDDELDVIMI